MEIQRARCDSHLARPHIEPESLGSINSIIPEHAVRSGTPPPVDLSESETVSPASTALSNVWDALAEPTSTTVCSELPSDRQIEVTEVKAARHRPVPCLQCEVKRLPCSKAHPSCSRCIRNGYGELCLAQRRMTMAEIESNDHISPSWSIIIRQETDDDKIWESKLRLQQEVSVCIDLFHCAFR